jgi:hypothetical protein
MENNGQRARVNRKEHTIQRSSLVYLALLCTLGLLCAAILVSAAPANPFLPLLFKQVSDWSPRATVTSSITITPLPSTATSTGTPTATLDAGAATLRVSPADQVALLAGGAFSVSVEIENVSNLGTFGFGLAYDPAVVEATDVILGPFLGSSGNLVFPFGPAIGEGWVNFSALGQGMAPGPIGAGVLAIVTFDPVGEGSSLLHLQNVALADTQSASIPAGVVDGLVAVTAGSIATYTPTVTPTSTPVGTPTSTPEWAAIQILNNYTTYQEPAPFTGLWIHGEVKNNTGSYLRYVQVRAIMYNADGTVNDETWTDLNRRSIRSGEAICFNLLFVDGIPPGGYWGFAPVTNFAYGTLPPLDLTVISHTPGAWNSFGYYEITDGVVRNNGPYVLAEAEVYGTVYNAHGAVLGCDYSYTWPEELAVGATGTFELVYFGQRYRDVVTYTLTTNGLAP